MARFLLRFLTGFVAAIVLSGIVFGRNGAIAAPHLFDVLTLEKLPPFALQVAGICAAAGLAWAFLDSWTHPSPAARKARKGRGVLIYALFRMISGFFFAALFTTYFIAKGSAAPGHAVRATIAALTPEGFAPIAPLVIGVAAIAALIWTVAGILSFNSGADDADLPRNQPGHLTR